MNDTITITPEERAKLISHVNSGYMTISGEGLKRALAALEQAEAENVRLTKIVGNFASIEAGRCVDSRTRNGMPLNDMCTVTGQIKAAREAVADGEETCQK